jgi:hypothetical protein
VAILKCEELPGREGQISLDGLARRYKRTFEVVTDDRNMAAGVVRLANLGPANRIPRLGEHYAAGGVVDFGAIADDIQAVDPEPDYPFLWKVTVSYRSRTVNLTRQQGGGGGSPESPQNTNPILTPAKVTWGTRKVLRNVEHTVPDPVPGPNQGKTLPIVNSAGTPFDPKPQIEIGLRTLTIVRNEAQFRPFSTQLFIGTTNEKPFQASKPETALCEDIRGDLQYSNGTEYFSVTYEFTFAPDDDPTFWYVRQIDWGPKFLKQVNGQWVLSTLASSTGAVLHDKLLLDPGVVKKGALLPGVDPKTGIYDGTGVGAAPPNVLKFQVRESNDFGDLHLPDPAWL